MSVRYNKLHQALAFRADRIVASSPHYARQHRSRYGPLVRAIPWGADPRDVSAGPVLRPDGELNVLFVGQMRPYKGVETLLAAAEGQPWLNLTLVGAGTELARYRGSPNAAASRTSGSPGGCQTRSCTTSTGSATRSCFRRSPARRPSGWSWSRAWRLDVCR